MNCGIPPAIGVSDLHGWVIKVQFLFLTSVVAIAIADGGTTIPDVGVGLANNARDKFIFTYAAWRRHDSR
jgi:hypothetical protein